MLVHNFGRIRVECVMNMFWIYEELDECVWIHEEKLEYAMKVCWIFEICTVWSDLGKY